MRRILALLLLIAIAPGLLVRDAPHRPSYARNIALRPLTLPAASVMKPLLGPFTLAGAWHITSPNHLFGGYSALLALPQGHMLAIGDGADSLEFAPPGSARSFLRFGVLDVEGAMGKAGRDSESATRDPSGKRIWLGWEGRNAISRHDSQLVMQDAVQPAAMHGWSRNSGAEAMVRLADGHFIVLSESYTGWVGHGDHPALLFSGDPVDGVQPARFVFSGPSGFRPTDMAQLPDGRVLVLMRRLLWPFPSRFTGCIVLLDPAQIRPGQRWQARLVARLEEPVPTDNYEGIAIVPAGRNRLAVWLISDDNRAAFQRTLLLKLMLDPRQLP